MGRRDRHDKAFAVPSAALAEATTSEITDALTAETGSVATAATPGLAVGGDELSLGGVEIGLPVEGKAKRIGGLTVLDSSERDAQVAVRPTGDGVRALVNLDSADAPERFSFDVGGAVAGLNPRADGSVTAYDASGGELGSFAPAWARDADGRSIATQYEVSGNQLTQVIAHRDAGAKCGVTADPFWIPAAVIVARCYATRSVVGSRGTSDCRPPSAGPCKALLMGLLTQYPAIKPWMKELAEVRNDRRATLRLLERARAEDAPADAKASIVLSLGAHHAGNEAVEAIGDVLLHDPAWRARAAACIALGSIDDGRARELLDTAAQEDPHKRVRENARFNRAHPGAFAA